MNSISELFSKETSNWNVHMENLFVFFTWKKKQQPFATKRPIECRLSDANNRYLNDLFIYLSECSSRWNFEIVVSRLEKDEYWKRQWWIDVFKSNFKISQTDKMQTHKRWTDEIDGKETETERGA